MARFQGEDLMVDFREYNHDPHLGIPKCGMSESEILNGMSRVLLVFSTDPQCYSRSDVFLLFSMSGLHRTHATQLGAHKPENPS